MPKQTSFLSCIYPCVAKMGDTSFTIVRVTPMPTSASPTHQGFDYTSLDTATSLFVQQQTGEIRVLMKRTVESIFEIGQRLITVKERLKHGHFGLWLVAEFDWSQDTANNFINVAKRFGQNPKISDFGMAASALYVLAAPSTPEAAREEAIARAKAGESITYTTAKAIKQKYAPRSTKPEPQPSQFVPTPTPAAPTQSASKLEIVAIRSHSQAPVEAAPRFSSSPATPAPLVPQQSPFISTPAVPGVWWQLGKHLLYCGDPNSSGFLERTIEPIGLLLAFPPRPNWQPVLRAKTRFIIEKLPEGKDVRLFEDTLESMLLLCSNVGEQVVVSYFLSSLDILSIINRLDRRGLFAEPDSWRVNALISDWRQAGFKAERLS